MEILFTFALLLLLISNLKIIMTQEELKAELENVTAKVAKIGTETQSLLSKITDLEAAIVNAGNVLPEVQAALESLKAQADVVDGLVPDAA
jgi:septal ring factor EnvC (AmiA/AmiB activator)